MYFSRLPLTSTEIRARVREREGEKSEGAGEGGLTKEFISATVAVKLTHREKKNPAEASTVEREEGEREGEKNRALASHEKWIYLPSESTSSRWRASRRSAYGRYKHAHICGLVQKTTVCLCVSVFVT